MQKLHIILILLIVIIGLTIIPELEGFVELNLKESQQENEEKINKLITEISSLKEQLVDKTEKINLLAEVAWHYQIFINNEIVLGNNHIKIETGDFIIGLREFLPLYYEDYTELLEKGRLDKASEHISLKSRDKLYKKSAGAGTIVDIPIIYIFNDLSQGSIIKFAISDELKRKLRLDTRIIKIEVIG